LALATAIGRLLDDRQHAAILGLAARQCIEDRFSVDRMVRSTEALYLELLARKRRKELAA
jgi:glycosyltransferase involved in cell wall biosynthesis